MPGLPARRPLTRTLLGGLLGVLGLSLVTMSAPLPTQQAAHAGTPQTGYVDVAAATLWTAPRLARAVDAPATGNPVDLRAWTDGLTLGQRRWLVGKLETQALYGTRLTILQRSGDWVQVVVDGQPTPRDPRGYPGWLPAAQLTTNPVFAKLSSRPFALVTATTAGLYRGPARRHRLMELSLDTRLPVLTRAGGSILVATPDRGAAWLSARDTHVYADEAAIPRPDGADLVATARHFAGLPYVWAGTSAWGFDCSGFTHTIYHVHGVSIPRDADAQFAAGTPVAKDAMRPGDLIFYAYSNGYVHHVGMYIGDGYEIDAPNNTATEVSTVEIVKLDEHRYADEYVGSRRFR